MVVVETKPQPKPQPQIVYVEKPRPKLKLKPKPKLPRKPQIQYFKSAGPLFAKPMVAEPEIGWAWYEREPIKSLEQVEGAIASITQNDWLDNAASNIVPEEVIDREQAWWNGQRTESV